MTYGGSELGNSSGRPVKQATTCRPKHKPVVPLREKCISSRRPEPQAAIGVQSAKAYGNHKKAEYIANPNSQPRSNDVRPPENQRARYGVNHRAQQKNNKQTNFSAGFENKSLSRNNQIPFSSRKYNYYTHYANRQWSPRESSVTTNEQNNGAERYRDACQADSPDILFTFANTRKTKTDFISANFGLL